MNHLKSLLLALLVCGLPHGLKADERSELKAKMAEAVAAGDRSKMADCAREAGSLGMAPEELKGLMGAGNPKLGMLESNFAAATRDLRKAELFLGGIDQQIAAAQKGLKAQAIKEGFKKLVEEQAPKPEDGVYKVIPGVGQYQEIKGVLEAMAAFGRAAKKGILTIEDLKTQRANAQRLVEELGWNGDSKGLCHVLNKDLVDYKDKTRNWDSDFDRQYKDGADRRRERLAKLKKDAEDAKQRDKERQQAKAVKPPAPAKPQKAAVAAKPTAGKPAGAKVTQTVEGGWVKDKNGTSKVTYVKDGSGKVLQVIHTHYDKSGKQIGKDVYPGDGMPPPPAPAAASAGQPGSTRQSWAPVTTTREKDGSGGKDKCGGDCK